MNFTYPKIERLRSKILIDKLFNDGHKLYTYPLKVVWLINELPENTPVQSMVSVSKRRFKRANKRNFLKRRIREAYRLNKNELYQNMNKAGLQLALIFIYNCNEINDFKLIESAIKDSLNRIIEKITDSLTQ